MNQYTSLDLQALIANKDLGSFMSKKTLERYANQIVSKMMEEVKLLSEVS